MKKVLVVSYSQTGQLTRAVESLVGGLDRAQFAVTVEELHPRPEYPFPWSPSAFFGVFPDAVLGRAPALAPLSFDPGERFDLVILAYQVWYLAPSLPLQAFFRSPWAAALDGTPVVTLVVCRNMWHTASVRMRNLIDEAGGVLMDSVVVTDRGPQWASFVTTPRWLFTGRRDPFWRVFPAAGVSDHVIADLARFGVALSEHEHALAERPPRPLLRGLGAVVVDERAVVPELIGRYSFPPWARVIAAAGRLGGWARALTTVMFVAYLVFAIVVLAPLVSVAALLLRPLLRRRLRSYIQMLEGPSGGEAAA